jgi:hypothetical protein
MLINKLYIIKAFNNKSFPLLLFFKPAAINIIIKERENILNINSKNKGKNILLYFVRGGRMVGNSVQSQRHFSSVLNV